MKKTMMYIAAAFMAISLAACTPTPQKEAETAVTVENTQGGGQLVEGKVPGPEEDTISVYSINEDGSGFSVRFQGNVSQWGDKPAVDFDELENWY